MSDEHYLDSYLAEILPALGLDAETYAPYVTADNDDDGGDGLDDIIELLKASSETHSEDDDAWENFRKEVIKKRQDYISGETMRKEMEAMKIQAATQDKLQKEIEISQQNAVEMEARKQQNLESSKVENMSAEKRALMAKYGFETPDGDTNTAGEGSGDTEQPITNRDHAAAVSKQNAQKQRSNKTQSKQEARQETKNAKAAKLQQKEERRKKAGKRERQRM